MVDLLIKIIPPVLSAFIAVYIYKRQNSAKIQVKISIEKFDARHHPVLNIVVNNLGKLKRVIRYPIMQPSPKLEGDNQMPPILSYSLTPDYPNNLEPNCCLEHSHILTASYKTMKDNKTKKFRVYFEDTTGRKWYSNWLKLSQIVKK